MGTCHACSTVGFGSIVRVVGQAGDAGAWGEELDASAITGEGGTTILTVWGTYGNHLVRGEEEEQDETGDNCYKHNSFSCWRIAGEGGIGDW